VKDKFYSYMSFFIGLRTLCSWLIQQKKTSLSHNHIIKPLLSKKKNH